MARWRLLAVAENWNSVNTVLHYGKDNALTGTDRCQAPDPRQS
ncbi:hypothetical protein ACFYVL_01155 [Streptomyces sp. NPDC004111]